MITFSLQSGSNGNSIYVEADGVRLLFDAGISGRQAQLRMAEHGRSIREVDALFLSHDHVDHTRCAGIYQRKFHMPIYVTRKTFAGCSYGLGKLTDVHHFRSGDTLEFGSVRVHTVPTPHDGRDPVAFVVECEGKRLGIFTDLGHPFAELRRLLRDMDAAYLESNYDPEMLATGPYPPVLQARIRGAAGHISNGEAAELIHCCGAHRPKWVALAHLSEQNNTPELALEAHRRRIGQHYPVRLAGRFGVSELFHV